MTMLFKRTSGIHNEAFYIKHYIPDFHIEDQIDDFMVSEKAIEEELDNLDSDDYNSEDEMHDCARRNVEESCLMYNYAYEPVTFDEDIAIMCHLIPFTIIDEDGDKYEILSFGGAGMDMTYKLEAYQLLADRSYDEHSNFAKQGIKYFENYFGTNSDIMNRIKRRTNRMIKYEKGKTKKITISILAGNKFKLRKTNLDELEVIYLLIINLAAFVAENSDLKETDNIIEELKRTIVWYGMKKANQFRRII